MPPEQRPNLQALVKALHHHNVDYMLIGGMAARIYGSRRPTQDLDIVARDAPDNMERLAAALNDLHATSDLADEASIDELWGMNTRWETSAGRVDVLVTAVGPDETTVNWRSLSPKAETINRGDLTLRIVALEDLIIMKLAVGRPKDISTVKEITQQQPLPQRLQPPGQQPYRGPSIT